MRLCTGKGKKRRHSLNLITEVCISWVCKHILEEFLRYVTECYQGSLMQVNKDFRTGDNEPPANNCPVTGVSAT